MLPDNCDVESGSHTIDTGGYNLQSAQHNAASITSSLPVTGGSLLVNNASSCHTQAIGQSASLICYNSRAAYHPYYYQIEDNTIVAYAPDNSVIFEDSPPSYEMALLCPSVNHYQYPGAIINAPIQVILPKEQCKEKNFVELNRRAETSASTFSSTIATDAALQSQKISTVDEQIIHITTVENNNNNGDNDDNEFQQLQQQEEAHSDGNIYDNMVHHHSSEEEEEEGGETKDCEPKSVDCG